MPRNVRNWWIEVEIDGRKHRLAGGPVSKTGGFKLVIRQRDRGEVRKVVWFHGSVREGGQALYLEGSAVDNEYAIIVNTRR